MSAVATLPAPPADVGFPAADVAEGPRRIRAEEFFRMLDAAVFDPDERLELIDGQIFTLPMPDGFHSNAVNRVTGLFFRLDPEDRRWKVHSQGFLPLNNFTVLLPDLALLGPGFDQDGDDLPGPGDVFLVVEVASTTLARDRVAKQRLYARVGIAEYWIVNRPEWCVEVYRGPRSAEERYETAVRLGPGQTVSLVIFPDLVIPVDRLLGRRKGPSDAGGAGPAGAPRVHDDPPASGVGVGVGVPPG